MRSCRSLILAILGLYLFVILLFHAQLRITDVDVEDVQTVGTGRLTYADRYPSNASASAAAVASGVPSEHHLIHRAVTLPEEVRSSSDCSSEHDDWLLGHGRSMPFQKVGRHFVYTAFYDDRLYRAANSNVERTTVGNDEEQPAVRILALVRSDARRQLPVFYCHVTYPDNETKSTGVSSDAGGGRTPRVVVVQASVYEMCENHAKEYGGWILTCPVAYRTCFVTVSLEPEAGVDDATSGLPVSARVPVFPVVGKDSASLKEFVVCVPPLFGHVPSTTIVEFVEMTRLLGATHIEFYSIARVPTQIRKTLDYYADQGLVTVINWDIPVEDRSIWYRGQLLAINDCLYRSMNSFRYVAFNDIDEFIVPRLQSNWTSLTAALERTMTSNGSSVDAVPDGMSSNVAVGYSFESAFFDPLLSGPTSHVLYDLESDLRTKAFSAVRSKVLVRPREVFEVGIHHVSRVLKPREDAVKFVDPKVAFVHHYRRCVSEFDYKMNCQIYVHDDGMARYIPALRHNVHQTLWTLKERHEREQERQNNNDQFRVVSR